MTLRKVAVVLAAVAAIVLGSAGIAQAAPPNGNDYTDPAQTGCSSTAITIWSKNLVNPATSAVNGVMELRYSTACQTNWVRIPTKCTGGGGTSPGTR